MSLAAPIPTFYQSRRYTPLVDRTVPRTPPGGDFDLHAPSDWMRQILMGYFDEVGFERTGVLLGEYALLQEGLFLLQRNGVVLKAAGAWEEPFGARSLDEFCATAGFRAQVDAALAGWDALPLVEAPGLLTECYVTNFYHYSLEYIPRLRHFPHAYTQRLLIAPMALKQPYQLDLIARTGGDRGFIPIAQPIRVRDPMLAQDNFCEDGLRWLRRHAGLAAERGQRRIYIRRGVTGTRTQAGGGLSETPETLAFLHALGFETIDFGAGRSAEAQVAMLDGAGLVLATHGAALTNLAYLPPGVSLVEIIGQRTPRSMFMHMASLLGFRYRGVACTDYDAAGDLVVDPGVLKRAVTAVLP